MPRSIAVRRSLAVTGAIVLATWSAVAGPADAYVGNGQALGHAHAKQESKDKAHDKADKADKGDKAHGPQDKGDQGNQDSQGNHGNQGNAGGAQSHSAGNGNGNAGGHTKEDKGDKGDKGPKGDPAGNNGTVKITPYGEMDGIPQNTPHVDCVFDIEWYGFDEGADIISTVEFAMHAPTSDVGLSGTEPSQVFVGGDPATGAGTETGFDGEATYHLVFDGEPHPKQGYHVKLTIHTPGSQGADTKHKVFWVQPCEQPVVEDDTDTDEDTTGGTTEEDTDQDMTGGTASTDETTEVLGVQASTNDNTEVLGEQAKAPNAAPASAADVPNAVAAGEAGNPVLELATSPLSLLLLSLATALGGMALVARRRAASL